MSIFPILNWCAGRIFWNRHEIKYVHSIILQTIRRVANPWPYQHEEIPALLRRTARWYE